mmetsp:Transcript_18137/g.27349  ORF Transcript_18137/g.27349 Transcript_18137/m.27349 type:complete len:137 (+) Transcript_18137:194-604(+)
MRGERLHFRHADFSSLGIAFSLLRFSSWQCGGSSHSPCFSKRATHHDLCNSAGEDIGTWIGIRNSYAKRSIDFRHRESNARSCDWQYFLCTSAEMPSSTSPMSDNNANIGQQHDGSCKVVVRMKLPAAGWHLPRLG